MFNKTIKSFNLLSLSSLIMGALILILPVRSFSQESTDRNPNLVYLELGGNCLVYSLNYERMIGNSFSFRAGASYFVNGEGRTNSGTSYDMVFTVPLVANYLFELNENHSIELGFGGMLEFYTFSGNSFNPTGTLGYRYSPLHGRMFFKAAFTPYYKPMQEKFVPWFGAGIGMQL